MEQNVKVIIKKGYENITIKEFLKLNHVGRPTIEKIRVNKASFINNSFVSLDYVLKINDILVIKDTFDLNLKPFNYDIKVAYEDEDILIVDKPVNMLVHSDGNSDKTLYNAVINYYHKKNECVNVRPIHRIDFETSGLVIFAKNFLIGNILDDMISKHNILRYYLALVKGNFNNSKSSGKISYRIGRDRSNAKKYRVSSTGQDAITTYKVINNYNSYSLVSLLLKTGRTHQIRVHMSYIGHPLLGDVLYGENKSLIQRVALHSHKIQFINPLTYKEISVKCDMPQDMLNLCR